ncbi:hypothetical protein AAMO2058_000779200 [Amorphochlora amoebiformis]
MPPTATPTVPEPPGSFRVVLIDNYDSFTYNLYQILSEFRGVEVVVMTNDTPWGVVEKAMSTAAAVIIGPGPGHPKVGVDFGVGGRILDERRQSEGEPPVLGVCLGHQGMASVLGGKVVQAATPMHGRVCKIQHSRDYIFKGIPNGFSAVRYNSLVVEEASLPSLLEVCAWGTSGTGGREIMALRHKKRPFYGVQFHPESVCTEYGRRILWNFLCLGNYNENQPHSPLLSPRPCRKITPPTAENVARKKIFNNSGGKTGGGWRLRVEKVVGWNGDIEGVFQSLYGSAPISFWLDSSKLDKKNHKHVPEAKLAAGKQGKHRGARFSFMGSGGGLSSVMVTYRCKNRQITTAQGDGRGGYVTCTTKSLCKRSAEESKTMHQAAWKPTRQPSWKHSCQPSWKASMTHQPSTTYQIQPKEEKKEVRDLFEEIKRILETRRPSNMNDPEISTLPFDFDGGLVGYIGYEAKRESVLSNNGLGPPRDSSTWREREEGATTTSDCRQSSKHANSESQVPKAKSIMSSFPSCQEEWNSQEDACLFIPDRYIAFDHKESNCYLLLLTRDSDELSARSGFRISKASPGTSPAANRERVSKVKADSPRMETESGDEWIQKVKKTLRACQTPKTRPKTRPEEKAGENVALRTAKSRWNREQYLKRIERCVEVIADGESYELCLTNQLKIQGKNVEDPLGLYLELRNENPAPYAAFFSFRGPYFAKKEFCILSSSPERFLRINRNREIESKPIKGTRPRGATIKEDQAIIAELKGSEKDFAENLMIVDLTRNDLGRVCIPGTVQVPRLMHVESYATVHQLVSTVTGVLSSHVSASDVVRAAFPPGSMTGAPKQRSTQLLQSLEGGRRGIYSGCIGYFGFGGAVDLNVVIRTIIWTPSNMTIGTGGAIVHLSEPEEEHNEMLLKTRAIFHALRRYDRKNTTTGEPSEKALLSQGTTAGFNPFESKSLHVLDIPTHSHVPSVLDVRSRGSPTSTTSGSEGLEICVLGLEGVGRASDARSGTQLVAI